MIRFAKHGGNDYLIVDSTFEINGINVPIHIQVNLSTIDEKSRRVVCNTVSTAFNRHIVFNKKQETKPEKTWWKFW